MQSNVALPEEKSLDYTNIFIDPKACESALRMAKVMSISFLVPEAFRNKPSDVLMALTLAASLKLNPFDVMCGIYVVGGKPSFTAQLAIALANKRGPFKDSIRFLNSGDGDSLAVTAYAKYEDGTEVKETFSLEQARKAGWARNKNYEIMPSQMLGYRAAMQLIRKNCPDVLMGYVSNDEHEIEAEDKQ